MRVCLFINSFANSITYLNVFYDCVDGERYHAIYDVCSGLNHIHFKVKKLKEPNQPSWHFIFEVVLFIFKVYKNFYNGLINVALLNINL